MRRENRKILSAGSFGNVERVALFLLRCDMAFLVGPPTTQRLRADWVNK